MAQNLEVKYGLPEEVIFCTRCVMSNQGPTSSIEFQRAKEHSHKTLHLDNDGVRSRIQSGQLWRRES